MFTKKNEKKNENFKSALKHKGTFFHMHCSCNKINSSKLYYVWLQHSPQPVIKRKKKRFFSYRSITSTKDQPLHSTHTILKSIKNKRIFHHHINTSMSAVHSALYAYKIMDIIFLEKESKREKKLKIFVNWIWLLFSYQIYFRFLCLLSKYSFEFDSETK